MRTFSFSGVHLFSVTPTDTMGHVAPDRLESHLNRAIDAGVVSITMFGSTGAIGSFDEAERKVIAEAAVGYTAGRVPVFIGTGSMNTAEAVRLSVHARKAAADGILVVPMTYWPLTEGELEDHYRTIADAAELPMILYNNPRTAGVDMSVELLARLCEIPGVVAVKESAPDVSRIADLIRLTKGTTPVLTGRDAQALDALMVGSTGWFSGGANMMPALCVELFTLVKAGRVNEARQLFDQMYPLCRFGSAKGTVRVVHTALEMLNQSMGAPRAPLKMLEPDDRQQLERLMTRLGLLGAVTETP